MFDLQRPANVRVTKIIWVLALLVATASIGFVALSKGSLVSGTAYTAKAFSPDRTHRIVLREYHRGRFQAFDVLVRRYYLFGMVGLDRPLFLAGRGKIERLKWRDNDRIRLNDYVLYIHNEPFAEDWSE